MSNLGMTVVTPDYVREFLKLNNWQNANTIWTYSNSMIADSHIDQDPNGDLQWIKDRTPLPHVFPGSLASVAKQPGLASQNVVFNNAGNISIRHGTLNGLNATITFDPYVWAGTDTLLGKSKCECGGTKTNTSHSTWCPVYKPFK